MNIIVYFLISIAVVFAFFSQGRKTAIDNNSGIIIYKYTRFNKNLFLLSFLILGSVCFLCKSGVDIPGYVYNYSHWDWSSLADISREPGYKILNIILNKIIDNPYIGIGVIKLLSIYLVFYSAYLVRDKVSIGGAILAYSCLLYIYNFQILRLMLALGIVFLAFSMEMNGKSVKCLILLALAFFFHYTSIFALLAYVGAKILGRKMTLWRALIISVVLILLFYNSSYLINNLQSSVVYFQKYEAYTRNMTGIVGFSGYGQLILFLPVLLILLLNYKKEHEQKEYAFHFILGLMTFACGALGYLLPNTRMTYYFYYFFFYYCSTLPLKFDIAKVHLPGNRVAGIQQIIISIYLILRFFLYLYSGGIESNGLEVYQFIWQ